MFTEEDLSKEIKWEHRRIRPADTYENLRISSRSGKPVRVTLVIQALHIDVNNEMANSSNDILPAYNEDQPHVAIEINSSALPVYSEATVPTYEESDLSDGVALAQQQGLVPPDSTVLPQYELTVVQSRQ
ncbi:hypothetical protein INT43_003525 [Umbelopsis isabellina]|uniref:Uncharacterized protein n=1 Tax=Mortierella isabellina TaxID=91625 RepID=A0A8H7PQ78_MORIS|nr:hypothetical protein INT43_003525 [Umbelopsis isabellina]